MKQSDHAQRHCVYLFSRKLLFTQQAEENVLWISLERFNILSQRKQCYKHWILKLHYFSLLDSHNSIVNNSKQQTNCIQKKMIPHATYCFVFFHDFDWHSEVHLSIMPSRQSCVTLLPLATSDSSSTSCEETIWVRVHIIIPPTIIACIACICIGTLLEERVVNEQFPPAKMCLTFGSSAESGTE